ncbi:hypothetical protein QYM36_013997 [Artemia franciscana]|uniref:Reverse transcriptase domain-containing protein n=1 Tax=Artemia franciscana TaxID=6661 RepID=A0AA88HFP0_ARTSF|nr:hypothetical protein QYM36_013997 [Artemia franciscana]
MKRNLPNWNHFSIPASFLADEIAFGPVFSYNLAYARFNLPIINMFLDFVAAFDSVTRGNLWRIMAEDGMLVEFVELLKAYYEHCKSIVRVLGEETEPFSVESGVKQGRILSHVLFNHCMYRLDSRKGTQVLMVLLWDWALMSLTWTTRMTSTLLLLIQQLPKQC